MVWEDPLEGLFLGASVELNTKYRFVGVKYSLFFTL